MADEYEEEGEMNQHNSKNQIWDEQLKSGCMWIMDINKCQGKNSGWLEQ